MGPHRNPDLFTLTTGNDLSGVAEEFTRRNLVTPALTELAGLFDKLESAASPLTDPALILKLHALAQVQLSHMGIAGFDPSRVVSYDKRVPTVVARAAPHHDSYSDPVHGVVRTRVCKLEVDEQSYGAIEMFALNVFSPDGDTETVTGNDSTPGGLILVGERGRISDRVRPITGEIVALAVRNTETGDAKMYSVTIRGGDQVVLTSHIEYSSRDTALVTLPGGFVAEVKVLSGAVQQQMVNEINAVSKVLANRPQTTLSDEEQAALRNIG